MQLFQKIAMCSDKNLGFLLTSGRRTRGPSRAPKQIEDDSDGRFMAWMADGRCRR